MYHIHCYLATREQPVAYPRVHLAFRELFRVPVIHLSNEISPSTTYTLKGNLFYSGRSRDLSHRYV